MSPLSSPLADLALLAYLDPASGSFIIQAVVAAIAASFVFLKYQGHRLMSLFGGKSKDDAKSGPDDGAG